MRSVKKNKKNSTQNLKKGDRVMIVGGAEAAEHAGKVWTLLYDPWVLGNDIEVAKIKCLETGDFYSSYAVEFLRKAEGIPQ